MTKVKLTDKEYQIIEHIRREGEYRVNNCQNRTVQNLIKKGLCEWNSRYNALKLTQKGKEIDL